MPCLTFSGVKVHLLEDENIENSKEYMWLDFIEILGNIGQKFRKKELMGWKLIKSHKNIGKNSKKWSNKQ